MVGDDGSKKRRSPAKRKKKATPASGGHKDSIQIGVRYRDSGEEDKKKKRKPWVPKVPGERNSK